MIVVTACAIITAPGGDDAKGKPPAKPEVLSLFDGKSLDGWKRTGFYSPGDVVVQEGAIVMPVGKAMTGVTSTRADLPTTDYELSYEARRLAGSDFFAAATFPVGKSFLTFVNGGWGGGVTGLSSINGADASENETNKYVKYKDKTWYRFRVLVTDKVVRCRVDDKEVVAFKHEGISLGTRVESRPCQPLGFATYESTGEVRKVEVRKLTPDQVATANKIDD